MFIKQFKGREHSTTDCVGKTGRAIIPQTQAACGATPRGQPHPAAGRPSAGARFKFRTKECNLAPEIPPRTNLLPPPSTRVHLYQALPTRGPKSNGRSEKFREPACPVWWAAGGQFELERGTFRGHLPVPRIPPNTNTNSNNALTGTNTNDLLEKGTNGAEMERRKLGVQPWQKCS
eukprot:3019636-Rhodomonas_salina.8